MSMTSSAAESSEYLSTLVVQSHDAHRPKFPADIERLIFEQAARDHRPNLTALMLVARRVKPWLEPILYSIVVRRNVRNGRKGYSPPTKNLSKYAHHVRSFLVYFHLDEATLLRHLTLCKNLTIKTRANRKLSTTTYQIGLVSGSRGVLLALSQLPLRQLGIHLGALPEFTDGSIAVNFLAPPFRNLTHLEIMDVSSTWERLDGFRDLPNLRYLSVAIIDLDLIKRILDQDQSEGIRVLVFLGASRCRSTYDRIVCRCDELEVTVDDWIAGVESKKCFWDIAEEMVMERRANRR
ncbi:hypothetical protein BDN72DRAFT_957041 [Pluteus cervinus]|uniref:Uncharacterized protein n=1 Tax=Pluteus cervinus TaxID=181527 RepID=A0ACD3B419_9AGAR|nr:hypothetical protein BDN72DRAFT_957041 [Pluteus cervinus]